MAKKTNADGFTIVEVLIALTIAMFIMLLVIMTATVLQRNQRNSERKSAVDFVYVELQEYKATSGGGSVYNANGSVNNTRKNKFINNYISGTIAAKYNVTFYDMNALAHSYLGGPNEISVMAGHWCNNRPGPSEDPKTSPVTGDHSKPTYFVVWGQLEQSGVFCLDNSTGIYGSN